MPEDQTRVFQTVDRHKKVVFSTLDSDKAFDVASRRNKADRYGNFTVVSYVLDEETN